MAETTLNDALARGQRFYGQTPQAASVETPPEEVVEDALEDASPEVVDEVPEDTPEEIPAEPAPPPTPAKTFKYPSQEEAERAQEEAARRMHEATTEAARIREQYDKAMQELEALKKPPEPPAEPKDVARLPGESLKNYIKRMRELDYNAESYDDEMESLWRDGLRNDPVIREFIREQMETVAEERFNQKIEQFRTTQAQEQERQRTAQNIQEQVLERAQVAGVDLQDEDLWDYFWQKAAPRADQEKSEAQTMEEKIDYALGLVKARYRLESTPPPPTPASKPSDTPPPSGASEPAPTTPPRRGPQPMARQSATVPGGGGTSPEAPKTLPTIEDHVQTILNRRRI